MKLPRLVPIFVLLALLVIPLSIADPGRSVPTVGDVVPADRVGQEDLARRTACAKHYWNADGTMQAKVWARPIHYRDEAGRWRGINEQPKAPGCVVEATPVSGDHRRGSGIVPPVLIADADPFPTLDSLVFEGNPTTQYSGDTVLGAQYDTASGEIYTYIRWTTITSANYGTITGVVLHLKVSARSTPIPTALVAVADVTSDWDSTVTWNTQPTNAGSPLTSSFDVAVGNTQNWTGAALDTEVDGWRTDSTSRDRGLALGFDTGAVDGDYVSWHSSDAASSADWPFISFTYDDGGGGGGGGSSGGCSAGSGRGTPFSILLMALIVLLLFRRR